jgi:hypothetical protein
MSRTKNPTMAPVPRAHQITNNHHTVVVAASPACMARRLRRNIRATPHRRLHLAAQSSRQFLRMIGVECRSRHRPVLDTVYSLIGPIKETSSLFREPHYADNAQFRDTQSTPLTKQKPRWPVGASDEKRRRVGLGGWLPVRHINAPGSERLPRHRNSSRSY